MMILAQYEIAESMHTVMVMHPWLFVLWIAAVGCAIGSFLNVVIYRLPAGMNIAHPPSRCPKCEKLIKSFDNIPILSWIALRGRCRNCKVAISVRYPIVESIVGIAFALLAFATTASVGQSSESQPWLPLVICLYHAAMFSTFLSIAFIHYDRLQVPISLICFATLISICVPLLFPQLRSEWGVSALEPNVFAASLRCLLGFVVGAITANVMSSYSNMHRARRIAIWGTAGAYLGWPSIVLIASISDLVLFLGKQRAWKVDRFALFFPPFAGLMISTFAVYQRVDIWTALPNSIRIYAIVGAACIIGSLVAVNRIANRRATRATGC